VVEERVVEIEINKGVRQRIYEFGGDERLKIKIEINFF